MSTIRLGSASSKVLRESRQDRSPAHRAIASHGGELRPLWVSRKPRQLSFKVRSGYGSPSHVRSVCRAYFVDLHGGDDGEYSKYQQIIYLPI